jgi:lipocalin
MENFYTPLDRNYCVTAQYTLKKSPSFWGYQIDVQNYAEDKDGNTAGGGLCADYNDDIPSQLTVAPCFLPKFLSGPYWVVAYDETAGYALISGGQPDEIVPDESGCGGTTNGTCCRTGTGINSSGLWIFSRSRVRDEELITAVRQIARESGFATSVLFDVNQTSCDDSLDGSKRRQLLRH